jgi:hypothetical protein
MTHRCNTARNDYKQGNSKEGQQQGQQTMSSEKVEVGDIVYTGSGRKGAVIQILQGRVRVKCEDPVPLWGHSWELLDDVCHAFRSEGGVGGDDCQPYSRNKEFEDDEPVANDRPPFVWNKEPEDETLYKDLSMTGDARRESFKELDTKTQYRLFMSQPVDTKKLPPVPKDWGEREQQAVLATILHIREPSVTLSKFGVGSESDDSGDDYAKANSPDSMKEYVDFVEAFSLCVPMMIGFHAKDGESKSCVARV